jgi:hypothetical protein
MSFHAIFPTVFRLLCGVSAIHNDILARRGGRTGRTEPKHRAGDLLWRADTASRDLCRNRFLHIGLAFAEGPVKHFGAVRIQTVKPRYSRSRSGSV